MTTPGPGVPQAGADTPRPGAIGRAIEAIGRATAWAFFVVFAIGTLEVFLRYALGRPTSWVHVTSTALALAAFAAGGAYAMVRDEHMRVTVLVDRAPAALQLASRWLGLACGAAYLLGLGWGLAIEAAQSAWRFEAGRWVPELTPGPPNWPLPALCKVALLLGAVLFLVAIADSAVRLARGQGARAS